ncbi:MAG TPA: GNAT family N-acetyltransferase [Candidatus Acidoferrales bacterium]|nr:GNAT family N-acetyltransferase [Candidatus Acidoferrales bacterium]
MTTRDIGVAMVRLGAETLRALMLSDARLVSRYGFSVARRAGLACFASTTIRAGVFNHVSGYGTFAEASQSAIDAVIRHYASRERPTAFFEVLVPAVTRSDRALLERNGFRDGGAIFQCHMRTSARPPRAHAVPRLSIAHVRPPDARRYAKLASEGFDDRGPFAEVFEHGWIREIERGRRAAAFMGRMNGTPAATGVLFRGPGLAGLYSGSVLKRYRGRGIQNAMIAARVAHGWARGLRTFYAWTDPDNSSARNLRDEGFRTRYEVHIFKRVADA